MIFAGYIFKVQIVFTILFIAYYAFLRREKFLVLNRFVLIGIIAVAFILPLSPALPIKSLSLSQHQTNATIGDAYPQIIENKSPTKDLIRISELLQIDFATIAMLVYIIVTIVSLTILFVTHYKVYAIIRMSQRHKANGVTYCEPLDQIAPFSFFYFVVVSKSAFTPEEYRQIITHESVHVRQLHTFDVLLANIACTLLWANPLIYLFRRHLKLNLEFLADEAALSSGIDVRDYQLNLLRYSGTLKNYLPVNAFFSSKIKERIVMINTTRPRLNKSYKYLLLPHLIILLSALVGFKRVQVELAGNNSSLIKRATENNRHIANRRTFADKDQKQDKRLHHQTATPISSQTAPKEQNFKVAIDARTDTVKFTFVADSSGRKFNGIYVIEDNVLTDEQVREAIKPFGRWQIILSNQPVIGMYSPNDSSAVNTWGEQARPGVVFVKARL